MKINIEELKELIDYINDIKEQCDVQLFNLESNIYKTLDKIENKIDSINDEDDYNQLPFK